MKKKKKVSVLFQVAVLFVIGVVLIGTISAVALYRYSTRYVRERLKTLGSRRSRPCLKVTRSSIQADWQKRSIPTVRCLEQSGSWKT